MSINWFYYPKSRKASPFIHQVVEAFRLVSPDINSAQHNLKSNEVLALLAPHLAAMGFRVETGKTNERKIQVPVLFGVNGQMEKSFEADAHHEANGFVLEVEAGRGVVNNQFLKDLFQACMMNGVTEFGVALRMDYRESMILIVQHASLILSMQVTDSAFHLKGFCSSVTEQIVY